MAGVLSLICPTAKSKYFCKSGWREFSDLPDGQMSLSQTQEKIAEPCLRPIGARLRGRLISFQW
jgi:hypothetical protein